MNSTSTMKEGYGQLGIIVLSLREYEKRHTQKFFKKKSKVDGMEADNRRAIIEIQKRSDEKNGSIEEDLASIQKNTENAARKVVHRTKAQREKEIMSTPENVRLREEAAARSTAKIKRRILRKQARKARAEHLVQCSLEPGKKKCKSKPLTELYVKGHFTEDREEWKKHFPRHCEEVYTDLEEAKEHRKQN